MARQTSSDTRYENGQLKTNIGSFSVDPAIYQSYDLKDRAARLRNQMASDPTNFRLADQIYDAAYSGTALTPQQQAMIDTIPSLTGGNAVGLASSALRDQGQDITKLFDNIGLQAQADSAKNRPFYRSAVKAAVPAAIGLGGLALGTAAVAPGALGSLSGALGGATKTASTATGGLGSSFSGLGSTLGKFSTDAALTGALKGGVGGLVSGGGFGDALKGAGLGAVTGGFSPAISGAIGGTLGEAVAGGLQGAAGGIATGDAKTAGIGAALGGLGGYVKGGGNIPGLGTLSGAPLQGAQGPTQGSGILGKLSGAVSRAGEGLSGLTGSSSGGSSMLGNALKIGGAVFEDSATRKNNERIAQALQEAQGRAQGYLSPYVQAGSDATSQLSAALKAGFQPGDLTQDPGYQFRLQEGEQALQRRMAASGLGQSGAALKAAQEYGQGLADQTYNDAYQRWLSGNQQLQSAAGLGQNSATNSAQLAASMGDAQAALMADSQKSKNNRLASILGGIGAFF